MSNQVHPQVSVIIVNYNGGKYLLDCVAVLSNCNIPLEVIVVDNASEDESAQSCQSSFKHITVIYSETNLGFAGGVNLGAMKAHGKCFIILNPDVIPTPGSIEQLAEEILHRGGVVGPTSIIVGDSIQEYGGIIDRMGLLKALQQPSFPLYIPGFCLATSRECFNAIGGLDNRYFLFYEDTEFCWQALRRGYEVRIVESALVAHIGGTAAPGGYRRNNQIESTSTRIILGGRNSIAMFLACAPTSKLPIVLFGALVRNCLFALLLIMARRPRTALTLTVGLWWNIKEAPTTFKRRNRPGVTTRNENLAWSRVSRHYFVLDHLLAGDNIRLVG